MTSPPLQGVVPILLAWLYQCWEMGQGMAPGLLCVCVGCHKARPHGWQQLLWLFNLFLGVLGDGIPGRMPVPAPYLVHSGGAFLATGVGVR